MKSERVVTKLRKFIIYHILRPVMDTAVLSETGRVSMENKELLEAIVNELLDEVSLGLCFEVHRSCKLGTFLLDEMDTESQRLYEIVNDKGLDVFGQVPTTRKQYDCICPNCHRNMAASRFAPHLEKCMGMGGSIPRVTSRRIVSSRKKCSDIESDDNSRDNDWTYHTDRKVKKMKKDKRLTAAKKSKVLAKPIPGKGSVCASLVTSDAVPTVNSYETMSLDGKRLLLHRTCGVISEHTKKMCTRSINCPQHTDDQRRVVRDLLLMESDINHDTETTSLDEDSLGQTTRTHSVASDVTLTPSTTDVGSPVKSAVLVKKKKKSKFTKKHSTASSTIATASQDSYHVDPD